MENSKIFYTIIAGIGIAMLGGIFNMSILLYLGSAAIIFGSMLIPQLDESNKPKKYTNTTAKEKVLDVEVIEPKPNNKFLNK